MMMKSSRLFWHSAAVLTAWTITAMIMTMKTTTSPWQHLFVHAFGPTIIISRNNNISTNTKFCQNNPAAAHHHSAGAASLAKCHMQEQQHQQREQDEEQLLHNNIDILDSSSRRRFLQKSVNRMFAASASTSLLLQCSSSKQQQVASAATTTLGPAASTDFSALVGGGGSSRKVGGLANKIRNVGFTMDELQRDLMQERWDLVSAYPAQLRSFVPLFTTFTDAAYPTDAPKDKGLRVALRYEVGRFFASVERLKQATSRQALNEAYVAYSDMSLHFDRYLHVGGLYTYYDATISLEPFYRGIADDALVYADPKKDPAEVRDLVVLVKGPSKGKTGIMIGIYPDGSNNCVVKLDKYRGMREVLVVPRLWAAKRLGEQDPDEAFLIPRKNNGSGNGGGSSSSSSA